MLAALQHSLHERLVLLCMAMLVAIVVALLAPLYRFLMLHYPAHLARALMIDVEQRLNRARRSDRDRQVRGGLLVACLLATGYWLGTVLENWAGTFAYGGIIEIFFIAYLLPMHTMGRDMRTVWLLLEAGNLTQAQMHIGRLGMRDVDETTDAHTIARSTLEALAQHLTSLLTRVLLYLTGGASLLLMGIAMETLAHHTSQHGKGGQAFGCVARFLWRVVRAIPLRLAALWVCIAALFVAGASPVRALRAMFATTHASHLLVIAALAGACGITLGGAYRLGGIAYADPWVGTGPARIAPKELHRSLWLYAATLILLTLAIAAGARLS